MMQLPYLKEQNIQDAREEISNAKCTDYITLGERDRDCQDRGTCSWKIINRRWEIKRIKSMWHLQNELCNGPETFKMRRSQPSGLQWDQQWSRRSIHCLTKIVTSTNKWKEVKLWNDRRFAFGLGENILAELGYAVDVDASHMIQ